MNDMEVIHYIIIGKFLIILVALIVFTIKSKGRKWIETDDYSGFDRRFAPRNKQSKT